MKRQGIIFLVLPLLAIMSSCDKKERETPEQEQAIQQEFQDEKEIREQIKQYIAAINDRDGERVANFWAPTAVYRNPVTGELVQGREGIKAEFGKLWNILKDAKVELTVDTIRFPMEGKASEEGISVLKLSGREPITSNYKMIHVKQDGKWLILHVSQLDFGALNKSP